MGYYLRGVYSRPTLSAPLLVLQQNVCLHWVSWCHEVVSEEHVTQDGVEEYEDESQDCREQDGLVVAGHAAHHIAECVILSNDVKELCVCVCVYK